MRAKIRRWLIAGLLVWVPIVVTVLILNFFVQLLDEILVLLPHDYRPANLLGFDIPGLGVVLGIIILFITGMLVTNFFGRRLVHFWDKLIARIPLVRAIYSSVKQVMHTLFTPGGKSFKKVLLVEYPRRGLWSIAFQTGEVTSIVSDHIGEESVTIFVPTTPNPTSGFLMVIPTKDVVELSMSVDEALSRSLIFIYASPFAP